VRYAMTSRRFPELVVVYRLQLTLFTVLSVASLFVYRRRPPGGSGCAARYCHGPYFPASYILVGTA